MGRMADRQTGGERAYPDSSPPIMRRGIFMALPRIPSRVLATSAGSRRAASARSPRTGTERRLMIGRDPQVLAALTAAKTFYVERGIA